MDRNLWKKNAYNAIVNRLTFDKYGIPGDIDSAEKKHLVVVYGPTQVGKTSMILCMINLKDEYFDEVNKVLRAGNPDGSSSTSTAIVYSVSESDDEYGYAYSDLTDMNPAAPKYCSGDELSEHLREIRKHIESESSSYMGKLNIMIPKRYFSDDAYASTIRIVDLPGTDSSNEMEQGHVIRLADHYVPLAPVCVIVCNANNMQSLREFRTPDGIRWQDYPDRFFVVLTHAYNEASTREQIAAFLKTPLSERKTSLAEFIEDIHLREIKLESLLGEDFKINVFPLDVGNSFNKLCSEKNLSVSEIQELKNARLETINSLKKSIASSRSGDRLKSALEALSIKISNAERSKINEINEKIESAQTVITDKARACKSYDEYIESYEEDIKGEKEKAEGLELSFNLLTEFDSYFSDRSIYIDLLNFIRTESLYESDKNGDYLKDTKKEKKVKRERIADDRLTEIIRKRTTDFAKDFEIVCRKVKNLVGGDLDNLETDMILDLTRAINAGNYKERLYPKHKFGKKGRVYFSEIKLICKYIEGLADDIGKKYADRLRTKIKSNLYDMRENISHSEWQKNNIVIKKTAAEEEISQAEDAIQQLNYEMSHMREATDANKKVLADYMNFAKTEYRRQHEETVAQINRSRSPKAKMTCLLNLALLEEDYSKFEGGFI